MENNETIVTEQVAENVEQTTKETQQPEKTYTQPEVDAIVGKAKARTRAKIEKENARIYGDLIDTLKVGTGKEDVAEINADLKQFYESKGFKMPDKAEYSAKDIEVLAKADAAEIIQAGYDEVVEEVDRLAELGTANMTAREKMLFRVLAEHRQKAERGKELAQIGVPESVYNSSDFQEFASKYRTDVPITEIYETYRKTHPQEEIKTMGSMKHSATDDSGVKDYYSYEEASKFTKADFDKNPKLFEAVQKSMQKW